MKFLIAFVVSGLCFAHFATAEFLTQATDVTAAGKPVHFNAGQAVTVVGVMQGNALVRVQLADGSATIAQIPAALLSRVAPAATPSATATSQSTTAQTPIPSASPVARPLTTISPSSPFPAPAEKGRLIGSLKFPELPQFTQRVIWWMDFKFKPADETFSLYIPAVAPAGTKYSVLGWISPSDGNGIPRQFLPLFDRYHIIAVTARNCGNNRTTNRRIGLMVSAIRELEKHYAIDPNGHFLSGFSGGGRASTWGGLTMPDFFSGVIAWCGTYFPNRCPSYVKGKLNPKQDRYGINDYVPAKDKKLGRAYSTASDQALAHTNTRFAMMSGSKDFNHDDTYSYYMAAKRAGYQVMFYSQDGLGHGIGNADSMDKALQFIFKKSTQQFGLVNRVANRHLCD